MSKTKAKSKSLNVWILGSGVIVLVLALALWVWPTYQSVPDVSTVSEVSPTPGLAGHLDVESAYQKRQQGAFLLDVRTPEEWQAGHIPGATLIPLDQLANRSQELPRDQEVVIYCRSGNRSAQALALLLDAGLENIYTMDGGINDWFAAGYEVVSGQ